MAADKQSIVVENFSEFYDAEDNSSIETNTTFNSTAILCIKEHQGPDVKIVMCVFYVIVFLLAISGNFLVGLVIGFNKQVLSSSDRYLFHLTLADIILALTLPFWATAATWGWVFGEFMCKLTKMAYEMSFYSSILFLVCISVDRYQVIVRAMETRKEHRRMISWVVCVGVWTIAFVMSISSAVLSYTTLDPDSENMMCLEGFLLAPRFLRHIFGLVLPLIIMVACYGATVIMLLKTRGFQKQRAMRVIVAVVTAFLICWIPYHMVVMADTTMASKIVPFSCTARQSVDLALYFTEGIARVHSCINPVLYAFVGEKFRRNLKQLFLRSGIVERTSISRFSRSNSHTSDANVAFM